MANSVALDVGSSVMIAVLVAGFCRNRGWSTAIPLLMVGLVIGLLPFGPHGLADPESVLIVILAPLVFGEGLTSSILDLRRVRRPVVALAVGLVVFGAVAVGFVAQWVMPGIWTSMAFALGAILGPTDAVAVSATARRAGLPRRLVTILEGESLVNDGTALTLLRVCSVAAAAGSITAWQGVGILATSVLGGLAVGAVAGLGLLALVRRARDTTVTNGTVLLAPLPVYFVAEAVHGSGILAVVVAALILAHGSLSTIDFASGRMQAAGLWMTVTFVLQSAAFFLVGLEMPVVIERMPLAHIRILPIAVPVVFLTLVVARFIFVYLMAAFSGAGVRRPGWLVIAWAGARGPVSALAAFTLPVSTDSGQVIPFRDLVISTTFGVVVLSLLLAPTVVWLAKAMDLPHDDDRATKRRVRAALARASLERLDQIEESRDEAGDPLPEEAVSRLRETAERRLELASKVADQVSTDPQRLARDVRAVRMEMMHAEQEALLGIRTSEGLPDDIVRELQGEIDARIHAAR
ncbi:MAG TPA: sodium:proton antiporter [Actinomycetota bacterium]|nr:sodium:proton antiporter [Actinomycetota bacterium]